MAPVFVKLFSMGIMGRLSTKERVFVMNFLKKITENPVFMREVISRKKNLIRKVEAGNIHFIYFIIMVGLFSLVILACVFYSRGNAHKLAINLKTSGLFYSMMLFIQGMCSMLYGLNTYNSFTRDKEKQVLESLASTALKPEDIVLGKFWAEFLEPARALTIFFPIVLFMGMLMKISFFAMVFFYLFSLMFCALSAMLGLYISITSRNNLEATIKCVMAPLYIILFPIIPIILNVFTSAFFNIDFLSLHNLNISLLVIFDPIVTLTALLDMAQTGDKFYGGIAPFYPVILPIALLVNAAVANFFFRKIVAKVAEIPGGNSGGIRKVKSYKKKPVEGESREDWIDRLVKKVLPASWTSFLDNPLFIRDTRIVNRSYEKYFHLKKRIRRNGILTFLAVFLLVALICISFKGGGSTGIRDFYFRVAFFAFFIMMLGHIRNVHAQMSLEKTVGGYDILISSLLTPGEIFQGKFWIFLYPVLKKIFLYSPIIIGGGILSGFTIPGILALFVLLIAFVVMADMTMLFEGILNVTRWQDDKGSFINAIFLFFAGLVAAAQFVDQLYQYLNIIPIRNESEVGKIFSIFGMWFRHSNGITDGLDFVTISQIALSLVIFLAAFVISMGYLHGKAVEKLGRVPEI